MRSAEFRSQFMETFGELQQTLETDAGDWAVKGFIDTYRNIYTISLDTKVISKIVELMLFPVISRFASQQGYKMILSEHQNHYPDITFIARDDMKFALDLKSTYRVTPHSVNGFTLGAFTGYFRKRTSTKNVTFPYAEYAAHFVLGIIYSRNEGVEERSVYSLEHRIDIVSVVKDFAFLLQEKWQIASDRPGSGNTKNIGSISTIADLIAGSGPFALLGEHVFDDYWMNYLTADMAKAIDSNVPFSNLEGYKQWRNRA